MSRAFCVSSCEQTGRRLFQCRASSSPTRQSLQSARNASDIAPLSMATVVMIRSGWLHRRVSVSRAGMACKRVRGPTGRLVAAHIKMPFFHFRNAASVMEDRVVGH